MNYKLNQLNVKLECSERVFDELPVMTGTLENGQRLFDTDYYCSEREIEIEDWTIFTRINKFYIERIAKMSDKKTSELFYQNADGHILIDEHLIYLYIIYRDEMSMSYLFSLLSDILVDGIACSDTYLYSVVNERFSQETADRLFNIGKQVNVYEDNKEEQES